MAILIYNTALSDADRQAVERYLRRAYIEPDAPVVLPPGIILIVR